MSTLRKGRLWLVAVVVLASLVTLGALLRPEIASFIWYRIAPDNPGTASETVSLPGLTDAVTVYLESTGIPHISASNEEDLLFAIGYVHGKYRFFQMDLLRRYAQGRLSELMGEQPTRWGTTVDVDATMRGWGFAAACKAEADALTPEMEHLLSLYTQGVNAALAWHVPVEYRLLRATPVDWRVQDTFAVGLMVAMGITHNWKQELYRFLLALRGGVERSEQLYPSIPWPDSFSLESSAIATPLPPAVAPELGAFLAALKPPPDGAGQKRQLGQAGPGMHAGSNAWVIGGEKTRSGKPILANDPHLTHLVPSIFFQQHIRCPGMDVIGVTTPGIPYVLIGHTPSVAWGMTSTVADVSDLYVEKPVGEDGKFVAGPGGPEPLEETQFVVRVKDGTTFRESPFVVRRTARGPLLNDLYPRAVPAHAPWLAVRWELKGMGAGIAAYRAANRATTVAELKDALSLVALPANNIAAADVHGTVALFTMGRIPIRKNHLGTFPAPAWSADYQWSGYVPYESLPSRMGSSGIVANGNNLMLPPERSGELRQIDGAPAYRHARIRHQLEQVEKHTTADSLDLQLDSFVLRGQRVAPYILADLAGLDTPSTLEQSARTILAEWDFNSGVDSAGAAVFFAVYREAGLAALRDEVEPDGLSFIMSMPYPTFPFDDWFESSEHPAWDDLSTPEIETRPDTVRHSFRMAVNWLARTMGDDPKAWRWGKVHDRHFKHPFGGRKLLEELCNMPRSDAAGAFETVNKAHFNMSDPGHPFRSFAGAALRMVIDLGDIHNARWVLDTGQSGWPGAQNYSNQYHLWSQGTTMAMISDWDRVKSEAVGVLSLQPGQ